MHHILLGLIDGWRKRRQLRNLLQASPRGRTVLELTPGGLRRAGVAALALDFDGVLAPHGAGRPLPEAERWLQQVVAEFGADKVVILSNRPEGPRLEWCARELPGVRFVGGVRKKPYPDGLLRTGELVGVPLAEILMADDRLLTGCLAALNAGCRPFYVRRPFVDWGGETRKELFFMLLRGMERLLVRLSP